MDGEGEFKNRWAEGEFLCLEILLEIAVFLKIEEYPGDRCLMKPQLPADIDSAQFFVVWQKGRKNGQGLIDRIIFHVGVFHIVRPHIAL